MNNLNLLNDYLQYITSTFVKYINGIKLSYLTNDLGSTLPGFPLELLIGYFDNIESTVWENGTHLPDLDFELRTMQPPSTAINIKCTNATN